KLMMKDPKDDHPRSSIINLRSSIFALGSGGFEQRQRREFPAQHCQTVAAQPAVKKGRVYLPEVGVKLQIPGVQLGEAGVLADRSGLDRGPRHEHARRRPVISSFTAVLLHPPSEL